MKQAKRAIVHVDDSSVIREIIKDIFEALDFEVYSLTDPTEVLPLLESTHCRIVISDIEMPQMNGLDLLQKIKRDDGGVCVIMLTGLVNTGVILQSMRWGAEACLFKPLNNPARLVATVEAALAKHDGWWASLEESHQAMKSVRGMK